MASFQSGGITEQMAVTATAGSTTTLTVTSKQLQVFTGSAAQVIVLPDATTMFVGQKFEIHNESSNSLSVEFNGGTAFTDATGIVYSSVAAHTSLIIKLQTNSTAAGTWTVSTSGSVSTNSGTVKNYLSSYIPSTSGIANLGNGNFETGGISGWSLAHTTLTSLIPTSVATAGSAFSSSSGGSAASGNLSLSVVSGTSAAISGLYSGSLASSAASVAGDMLISSAFNIDREDQTKVMTVKFYYTVHAGASVLNFSSTSTNSFAVYIYDVTNGLWIQPAGVYGMGQNSGTGYATATFQTSSNSTQYQLAVVNINASTGAYTLYVDDFALGPQTVPLGVPASDWTAYTPIITASTTNPTFGTIQANSASWTRIGDSMRIRYTFRQTSAGTNGSGRYQFALPPGYSINTAKINAGATGISIPYILGSAYYGSGNVGVAVYTSVGPINTITLVNADNDYGSTSNASDSFGNANAEFGFDALIPIQGWSSNVQMSSDTDTRIVDFVGYIGTNVSLTAGVNIPLVTVKDSHGAWTGSTYVVPVSGDYDVLGIANPTTSTTWDLYAFVNGASKAYLCESVGGSTATGATTLPNLKAGDIISFSVDTTIILTASTVKFFTIARKSGPSVIAASESVNARYFASTSAISGSFATITYSTKDYDSHNAYSGGIFTAPVSGKYEINAGIIMSGTYTANNQGILAIFKNGTQITTVQQLAQASSASITANLSDIISCLAGDLITIRAANGGTSPAIQSNTTYNYFSISRTGN